MNSGGDQRRSAAEAQPAHYTIKLSPQQLERLHACAKGISLRFDDPELVGALIAGGYVEKNIAGVVRVTAKGHEYLRAHGY